MPKAITYKSNSVVYFAGDVDERVFLLQTGSIALTTVDIETGDQVTNYIKEGEFFGVKSALGGFPREDNAIVLANSVCLAFQVQEFENFAQSNPRIILQMIKVFSKQLRSIHRKLASVLDIKEDVNPEDGLFSVVTAFYNSQHYDAANQVCIRYIQNYPQGKYKNDIIGIVQSSKGMQGHSFGVSMEEKHEQKIISASPQGSVPPAQQIDSVLNSMSSTQPADFETNYRLGCELFQAKNPSQAYAKFQAVIDMPNCPEDILADSYIKGGRCLFDTGDYMKSMQILTAFIGRCPKSQRIAEALVYLGLCHERMNKADKAAAFYEKALLFASPALAQKIKELQANLQAS